MKNQRRSLRLAAAAGVIAISLAGCAKPLPKAEIDTSRLQGQTATQVIERTSSQTCINPAPTGKPLSEMVVGFSQSENEQNPFRALETASVKAAVESKVKGFRYTNANSSQAKQLTDILSMINQGVDALVVAPISSTGLQSAFAAAKEKGIPVVTIDRKTQGEPCTDYLTFLGSDFYQQGVRAARAMADATGGTGRVAEIQGAPGNDVATMRTRGFHDELANHPGIRVLAQQTANWATSEAQQVTEQILAARPDINGIYTHSDTMALGALTAVRNYGKAAGEDIHIVSIDGTRDAVKYVADGKIHAVVETNPRFGPGALKAIEDWFAGRKIPEESIMKDSLFTHENAQQAVDSGAAY
ncbi:ABC transporter substrate-binding protein [Arthrobacter globiformis]|uniref:ABC transporter substrate-binding protein n=1 Tax=Arthrobacter globiformis TaxID=1665 RepID=UPI0027861C9E|nr:ABC transporter substrate-binding protein [Arthrobacter globiformis]MDQ0867488.1 ABC-type sugar transport system substrate-binding protein [Arthrobacter globiformis]